MSRFYGFTPDCIDNMQTDVFYTYLKAIEAIEARETINAIIASEYTSNMKQRDRSKVLSNLNKKAYPNREEKVLSTEEVFKDLMNGR